MTHVSTFEVLDRLKQDDESYAEVLSTESMRVELAHFPNPEPKTPHKEDELYVILAGAGRAQVGDETHDVAEGDVVYVEQGREHDFFDIEDEMTALVVFGDPQEAVIDRTS